MIFDYQLEERRDILCIDVKSFFASVECVAHKLNPLEAMLVVMSNAENAGGLVLAASPMAKKKLGISNVSRKYDIPLHPDLKIVPPRMRLYAEKNLEINDIYKQYVAEEDWFPYSIDESFIDLTASKKLFGDDIFKIARDIQRKVYHQTGLVISIGIGDNPLLAKLALDNAAKNNLPGHFTARWRYEDVPETLWKINHLTDMWGIGRKNALRLNKIGIDSVYDLAHANYHLLSERFGVMGQQLFANSWGIDRSRLSQRHIPKGKSFGHSQILPRDYTIQSQVEVVIREMADQIAGRLRQHHTQAQCVHLFIGYSKDEFTKGFAHQMKIPATNQSKKIADHCLTLFQKYYTGQAVRQVGISCSQLVYHSNLQLDLFEAPEKQVALQNLDPLVDAIRQRYGFQSLIHASSLLEGGTAVYRSTLLGGHKA